MSEYSNRICDACEPLRDEERPIEPIYPLIGIITIMGGVSLLALGMIAGYWLISRFNKPIMFAAIMFAFTAIVCFTAGLILFSCFYSYYRKNVRGLYIYVFLDQKGQLHVHREDPRISLHAGMFGFLDWSEFDRMRVIFRIRIGGYFLESRVLSSDVQVRSWRLHSWIGTDIRIEDCTSVSLDGEMRNWDAWMPQFLRMAREYTTYEAFQLKRSSNSQVEEAERFYSGIQSRKSIPALRSSPVPKIPGSDNSGVS